MVSINFLFSATLFTGLSSCTLNLHLKAQPLDSGNDVDLGTLIYNQELQHAKVINVPETKIEEGRYCFGPIQNGKFECQSVAYLSKPFKYQLKIHTKDNGDLSSLSLVKSTQEGIIPTITNPQPGAQPVLIEPPSPVINEKTGEVVNGEKQPPKSFIQKYWMYIVPVLILLIAGQSEPSQQGRPAE